MSLEITGKVTCFVPCSYRFLLSRLTRKDFESYCREHGFLSSRRRRKRSRELLLRAWRKCIRGVVSAQEVALRAMSTSLYLNGGR